MSQFIKNIERFPNYTVLNTTEYPINPYREMLFYASCNVFQKDFKSNLSLDNVLNMKPEERKELVLKMEKLLPGVELKINNTPEHQRIFLEFEIVNKGSRVGTVRFYTHVAYSSSKNVKDKEEVAVEFKFDSFDGFDFLNVKREDNIFDFAKNDKNTENVDMIFACISTLSNFNDYIKYFKTKSMTVKNIDMFATKFIRPYVMDMQCVFNTEEFIIAVLCGTKIHKKKYPYDKYLDSVKEFGAIIKEEYGDKWVRKDEKEKVEAE